MLKIGLHHHQKKDKENKPYQHPKASFILLFMKFHVATITIDQNKNKDNKKYNSKNQLACSEHNIVNLWL